MGRTTTAYSCPCGHVDDYVGIKKHFLKCKIHKDAIKRDNEFKRLLFNRR